MKTLFCILVALSAHGMTAREATEQSIANYKRLVAEDYVQCEKLAEKEIQEAVNRGLEYTAVSCRYAVNVDKLGKKYSELGFTTTAGTSLSYVLNIRWK